MSFPIPDSPKNTLKRTSLLMTMTHLTGTQKRENVQKVVTLNLRFQQVNLMQQKRGNVKTAAGVTALWLTIFGIVLTRGNCIYPVEGKANGNLEQ